MGCKKLLTVGSAAALTFYSSAQLYAEDTITANTITMPSGIDIPSLIQSGITVLGGVVAVALTAWGTWVLIRKALSWVRKAF